MKRLLDYTPAPILETPSSKLIRLRPATFARDKEILIVNKIASKALRKHFARKEVRASVIRALCENARLISHARQRSFKTGDIEYVDIVVVRVAPDLVFQLRLVKTQEAAYEHGRTKTYLTHAEFIGTKGGAR